MIGRILLRGECGDGPDHDLWRFVVGRDVDAEHTRVGTGQARSVLLSARAHGDHLNHRQRGLCQKRPDPDGQDRAVADRRQRHGAKRHADRGRPTMTRTVFGDVLHVGNWGMKRHRFAVLFTGRDARQMCEVPGRPAADARSQTWVKISAICSFFDAVVLPRRRVGRLRIPT